MSAGGYVLRVYMKGREPADAPLSDENGRAFAQVFAQMEQNPVVAALFEQMLAQKWPEIAQQMFEAGTLPYVPTLEEVDPEFELIVPDEETGLPQTPGQS
jgi:hypothetical protein